MSTGSTTIGSGNAGLGAGGNGGFPLWIFLIMGGGYGGGEEIAAYDHDNGGTHY